MASYTRAQVLTFRTRVQQLDRDVGDLAHTAVLDIGVQDTGADGARWALAVRSVDASALSEDELVLAWTLRGAPHAYRRSDLPHVAAAVEPYSDADAGKRIFDASKPLKEAGIGNLEALDAIAQTMRSLVTRPMVKGEVSSRLTPLMDEPYRRFCRPCNTIHLYEQPFRLAALRAGLELEPGTSPPVLRPIAGFERADRVPPRFDVIRAYLRLLGPATSKDVAAYIDAPAKDVKARWPSDAVEVDVEGERRWVLAGDEPLLQASPVRVVRLLAPFDLFLQARDRRLLVADSDRAKALWPTLGRPGAVLIDGDIAGTWRARKAGSGVRVTVEPWTNVTVAVGRKIRDQARRLAEHRGLALSELDLAAS